VKPAASALAAQSVLRPRELAAHTVREIANLCPLVDAPLPAALGDQTAIARGQTLRWSTRAYRSPGGPLARLQMATVTSDDGSVASLTVVARPLGVVGAPLFAADLLAQRGKLSFVALDLVAPDGALAPATDRALAAARDALVAHGEIIPGSLLGPFSPSGVAVAPAADRPCPAIWAYGRYLEAFLAELLRPPRFESRRALTSYGVRGERMTAHLARHPVLVELFGAVNTARYFDAFFDNLEA